MFIPVTKPFLDSKPPDKDSILVLGIPYDSGACFRKGARYGPDSIREFSENLESFSPLSQKDLSQVNYADIGNLQLSNRKGNKAFHYIKKSTTKIIEKGHKPLFFGGDHSISYPIIAAFINAFAELRIIHFDAHADLRVEFEGDEYSNACVMGNCLKLFKNPKHRLFQLGIRSFSREEFEKSAELGTIHKGDSPTLKKILRQNKNRPVYVSIDLDLFDPAFVPGTANPEAGGWSYKDFEKLIPVLAKFNIVGADIVELAPNWDKSGASSALAAKLAREILLNFF